MIFQKGTDKMLNTFLADWNKMIKESYYYPWIKLLEGHYLELFRSSEYSAVMVKTLSVMNEFVEARQTVVNDLLRQFNIPTHQDLDELAKEIYLLKRRMRAHEKNER